MYAENLIGVTQNFLRPDVVNRFSSAIGESTEKTQKALKTVIPTLLMGIINRGQAKGGGDVLVNLVHRDAVEGEKLPEYGNEAYLEMGTDAVQGIFGNNLNSVVSDLGDRTGIQTSGINKMLRMAAPLIMGFLGTKMKRESLSTPGLVGFLDQQKNALNNLVPEGLIGRFTGTSPKATPVKLQTKPKFSKPSIGQNMSSKKNLSPTMISILFAIGLFALLWWFTGRRSLTNIVSDPETVITSTDRNPVTNVVTPIVNPIAPAVDELLPFLQSGSAELPKSFRLSGSEIELEKIAAAMNEFPNVLARIEGYTDNSQGEAENLQLGLAHAAKVKEELVRLGINENRMSIVGLGSSKPIADNDSAEGRAQNQRIEFVITKIE